MAIAGEREVGDPDIQKLITILTDEAPLHQELLKAMISRFKKGGNSVITAQSPKEKQMEDAKAAAIVAFNAVKADPSDENKSALQNAEAVYYLALADLVEDTDEDEKDFQKYILGKLKLSAIDIEEQVAAGSPVLPAPEEPAPALEEVTAPTTEEAAPTTEEAAPSSPLGASPAPEEVNNEVNGNSLRRMFNNNSAAAPEEEVPAPSTEEAAPEEEVPAPSTEEAAPSSPLGASPASAEVNNEVNGNSLRRMFNNNSAAAPEEEVAAPTPSAPEEEVAAPAAVVPEGWSKEEVDEYSKLSEPQKEDYMRMKPTIGLNESVKNWRNVMQIAKGSTQSKKSKKGKQSGGGRSVTPIGKGLEISLKKVKTLRFKKSKESKTFKKLRSLKKSRTPKKSRKSKA